MIYVSQCTEFLSRFILVVDGDGASTDGQDCCSSVFLETSSESVGDSVTVLEADRRKLYSQSNERLRGLT